MLLECRPLNEVAVGHGGPILRLDAATHARFALIALLGVLLVCAVVGGVGEQRKQPASARVTDLDALFFENSFTQTSQADSCHLAFLDTLLHRTPSAANYKGVISYLDSPNWRVAGLAHQVLRTHDHPAKAEAQVHLVERFLAESHRPAVPWESIHQHQARVAVLREVLDCLEPTSVAGSRELLVRILDHGPDSVVRARALELLVKQSPERCRPLVLAAVADPSDRVRLTALDIISKNGWAEAAAGIETLASSPRPVLRRRAAEVLHQFGRRIDTIEYGESVLQAAQDYANQLWQAGLQWRDVVPEAAGTVDEQRFVESLHRHAEDYLDRSLGANSDPLDSQGVLFLAAAARTGQRKLTLRLWEYEVTRTDSAEELRSSGMETLARNRILAGLVAYQRGEQAEGLQELASVAKIARAADPASPVQVYVRQAGALSAAIWQTTIRQASPEESFGPPHSDDPVACLAARLLDRLDLTNPNHRAEARHRIDAWCGLVPSPERTAVHRNLLAN